MHVIYFSKAPALALPPGTVAAAGGLFSGFKLRRQRPDAAICASPAVQIAGAWPQIGLCRSPEDAYRYRPGTHLVAATKACAAQLAQKGREVICLPMPLPDMASALGNGAPHILAVAPLVRASNLDLLLKAVAGRVDVTVTLAGEGSAREDLAELAGRLKLRVNFIAHATPEDYQRATLIVHPVRADMEGAAIRAAHASARPLIAAATEAARELIVPNETGLLIPLNDVAALGHSIGLVIEEPGLAAALAQAGHEFHLRSFGQGLIDQRWQRYLGSIIAPPPSLSKSQESFNVRRI